MTQQSLIRYGVSTFFVSFILIVLPVQVLAVTFDSDVPSAIQTQMKQDLEFMTTIHSNGASLLHQKIFGEVEGKVYEKFFISRVKSIGLDDCGSANAVACVMPYNDSSKMWLTENYIKFSHPQIARLMVVYHEARHTERKNGFWSHADCPTPFLNDNGEEVKSIWTGATLSGEPACDVTPLGSYGSSMILLKNVQKFCINCTEKVLQDAGIYADDQYGRVINENARKQIKEDLYQ